MADYGILGEYNTDPWRGVLSDPRMAYRTQFADPQPQQIVTPDSRAGRTPESYGVMGNPAPLPQDPLTPLYEAVSPMVAGYGAGQMASYAKDAAQSGDYGTATGAGLMAAMSMMPMKKGAAPVAAAERPTGIRAYHGSPHDFDRFDISKIGTGEGAQAYGHGLYFAENEATAKSYRDVLKDRSNVVRDAAGNAIDDARLYDADPTSLALRSLKEAGDFNTAQKRLQLERDNIASWRKDTSKHDEALAEISRLRDEGYQAQANPGRMYEVNIKADPEHFLDWDKPLSQQSEYVRDKWGPIVDEKVSHLKNFSPRNPGDAVLAKLLQKQMTDDLNHTALIRDPALHEKAKAAGIPGVRYLDQGSRGAGEGSRNYVVFDPATIEIMRKYGLMGPMAGGVAAGAANGILGDQ